MGIIHNLRNKIGYMLLNSTINNCKYKHYSIPFKNANNIGVLYNVNNSIDLLEMNLLIELLCKYNKNIYLLYYSNNKQKYIKNYNYEFLYVNYFNKKNINYIFHPKCNVVQSFIKTEFDILIAICFYAFLPIDYISGLSKAKFRIGLYNKININYLDLIFDLKNDDNINSFIINLKRYFNLKEKI